MANENILLVEDQQRYLKVARAALVGKPITFATKYEEAIKEITDASAVMTDVFFQENEKGNSSKIQFRVLEQIKRGMIKRNVEDYVTCAKERCGIDSDERLIKCFETLAYNQVGFGNTEEAHERMKQTALIYVEAFKEKAAEGLEKAMDEMGVGKFVSLVVGKLMNPLENYMQKARENQPLGYLVAEEAEKLGKPFVLMTSLRHSEGALIPVIMSTKARGWNLIEGADGSKENIEYWKEAYKKLTGEKK
ncbi:hypothetical protein KA107_02635 [Candidatus Pacearchaeota archaeon]|nr:hypothetical protein [Candidatus Pacearchaeota archaeon]